MKIIAFIIFMALLATGCGSDRSEASMTLEEEAYYVGYHFGLADICAGSNVMQGSMPFAYDDSTADNPGDISLIFDQGYRDGYDPSLCQSPQR